ncbi:MAG: hypothetical protein LBP52_08505 [Burkholderiaceae bacterium]|jgi:hypothetical protein|nr:hypothetical protein [Burkholderiaceae bacterium]
MAFTTQPSLHATDFTVPSYLRQRRAWPLAQPTGWEIAARRRAVAVHAGRLALSGSLADVCAELTRLAAHEARLARD